MKKTVRYQLVFQFPETFFETHDDLVAFEDKLIASMPKTCCVDGHDIGSGTINFFVFTDSPLAAHKHFRKYSGQIRGKLVPPTLGKSVPPTFRTVRCRTVPRTCHARIDHTHSLVSGRAERWPSRNAEGFRRPAWLALWDGMICQVKYGEPCFASSRYGLAVLSCFQRPRSMASGTYTDSRTLTLQADPE